MSVRFLNSPSSYYSQEEADYEQELQNRRDREYNEGRVENLLGKLGTLAQGYQDYQSRKKDRDLLRQLVPETAVGQMRSEAIGPGINNPNSPLTSPEGARFNVETGQPIDQGQGGLLNRIRGGFGGGAQPLSPLEQLQATLALKQRYSTQDAYVPVYNYDPNTGKITDSKGQEVDQSMIPRNAKIMRQGGMFGQSGKEDISNTVQGIEEGKLSPRMTDYSFRDRTAIASNAQRAGLNLNKMMGEYNAVQKYIQTANGPQQLRLRQAISSVRESINNLKGINEEFKRTGWTPANKAELMLALSGTDSEKRDIASRYVTQLNVIVDEMGTVFMGGNSPTDRALLLAKEILNKNYGKKQLDSVLDEVDKNLQYRSNAIDSVGPQVIGGESTNENYFPRGGQREGSRMLNDPNIASEFLRKAGGDKEKARELARQEGWEL
jgi:hypothetical protein